MNKTTLTRQELYELVWKEPLASVLSKYEIKYPALRRMLIEMNIPIPGSSYWSRIKFGKLVEIKPLPVDYNGKNVIELIERVIGVKIVSESERKTRSVDEDGNKNIYKVPAKLTNPDSLITNTKEYYDAVKKHDWRSRDRYPEKKDVLSIDVQYSNLPRALRIFDTIIKILRSRGHEISFDWSGTIVVIYGQEIGMRLREMNKVSDKPRDRYSSRELEPTGKFSFLIGRYHDKGVNDGRVLLEDKISDIIFKLEAEGKQWHDWHIEAEIREKERQEQQRIEQEARDRKNKELSDFKSLYILANRLNQSRIMRDYLSLIEVIAQNSGKETAEFRQWLEWAQQKIDWYDPLINRVDYTFNDEDKARIFNELLHERTF